MSRTGYLFQGRYKAILINADKHLLELIRYIHLNSLHSGLVNASENFQWSGQQSYLGIVQCPWLTTDWGLRRFSKQKPKAVKNYGRFVYGASNREYREEFHSGNKGGIILGDNEFIDNLPKFGRSVHLKNITPFGISEISKQICNF